MQKMLYFCSVKSIKMYATMKKMTLFVALMLASVSQFAWDSPIAVPNLGMRVCIL